MKHIVAAFSISFLFALFLFVILPQIVSIERRNAQEPARRAAFMESCSQEQKLYRCEIEYRSLTK